MPEGLRLAEVLGALSLATDLGVGQPLEQALRTCLIALQIGERLGLNTEDLSEVYYVSLLRFLGCTADAHEAAELAGGDDIAMRAAIAPVLAAAPPEFMRGVLPAVGAGAGPLRRARLIAGMLGGRERAREGVRSHCELAENLSSRLGLPDAVRGALGSAFEQWNGAGMPDGLRGEAIPLASRIVFVARDAEVLHRLRGPAAAIEAIRSRSGSGYDPAVVDCFLQADPGSLLAEVAESSSPWDDVLRREPEPKPWIPDSRIDTALSAFADFVDVKCAFTAGHSRQVAQLVSAVGGAGADKLRRAALVHDLGRCSVPNGVWEKPGPLTEGEWERVRLHPYYSERIVGRVAALRDLAAVAGKHHERIDGSGYHRGSGRTDLPWPARVLAAADAYQAMTQPRPHRPAFEPGQAAAELEAMAGAGRLDREAVHAVLTAAGHQTKRSISDLPAGMTEREVEVLRLICRGDTKKDVAARLSISVSTVDHHVRHIYDKASVKTRAGATLFALEHDLLK